MTTATKAANTATDRIDDSMRLLEASGYRTRRLGDDARPYNVVAIGPRDVVLLLVRSGDEEWFDGEDSTASGSMKANLLPELRLMLHRWRDGEVLPDAIPL
ncbi:MAG TPA: hypothetical protein VFD58_29360 [Blastocatellia bacterium]|nr:hypothetical protein [Blastocatellia bacterium]